VSAPAAADVQDATPHVDAARAYAGRPFVRVDVPGHGGDAVAQPELAEVLGEHVLALDLPPSASTADVARELGRPQPSERGVPQRRSAAGAAHAGAIALAAARAHSANGVHTTSG